MGTQRCDPGSRRQTKQAGKYCPSTTERGACRGLTLGVGMPYHESEDKFFTRATDRSPFK